MKLDPKGLDAARYQPGTNHDGIIRAYLTALTPAEVGGLVERLDRLVDAQIEDNLEYIRAADEAMSEAATALEAQAAELAEVRQQYVDANEARIDAEAQLAEARKALEPFAWIGQWFFARDLPDETPVVVVEGAGKPFSLTRGMFKAAHTARRTLTGGQEE